MSVEQSLLGKETQYPTSYQPDVLFPIARAQSREKYAHIEGITQGKDWWHVFRNFLVECSRYSTGCYWQNYTASFFTEFN